MSKANWNTYKENEWREPIQLDHRTTMNIDEQLCTVDHTSTKGLKWDDCHCGLDYYNCPECGNMFMFL